MAFLSKPNNAWVAYLRLRMVKKQSDLAHELRMKSAHTSLLFQRVPSSHTSVPVLGDPLFALASAAGKWRPDESNIGSERPTIGDWP
jgi:hypothetical protein